MNSHGSFDIADIYCPCGHESRAQIDRISGHATQLVAYIAKIGMSPEVFSGRKK